MTLVADIPARRAPAHRAEPPDRDQRIAVAMTWLCMLGGLVRIGVRFSAFLSHQIAPEKGGPRRPMMAFRFIGDPFDAYDRVARATRLAAALFLRISEGIDALKAGKLPSWAALARHARRPQATRPKAIGPKAIGPKAIGPKAIGMSELAEAVAEATGLGDKDEETALESLHEAIEAPERAEALFSELREMLREEREDAAFYRLLGGPLKDAVAAICADLGLKPDWSLWTEDGFPPPGGEKEDWIAFFLPEAEAAPAASPVRPPPTTHPPACIRDPRHVLDPPRRDLNAFLTANGVKPRPPPPFHKSACRLPPLPSPGRRDAVGLPTSLFS